MMRRTRARLLLPLVLTTFALSMSPILAAQELVMNNGAFWNTCTGLFHDSGGPNGNYGNNENLIATLCPLGGAGSGAASAVHFLQFDVGAVLDQGDVLTIHNGLGTASPVLVTGSFSYSLAGLTVTATGPSGCLTFHWTSNLLGTAAGWTAEVVSGPNAGTDASLTLCSTVPAFSLFGALGGAPTSGGAWTGPAGPHAGIYDPANDPGGVYTYTVIDGSQCVASATVTIIRVLAPNAGESAIVQVCDVAPPFELFYSLAGTPDEGGSWNGPGGTHGGLFDPGTDQPGTYTYTVTGTPPCTNDMAVVEVLLTGPPNAGTDASIQVCDTIPALPLITVLGGDPDLGGMWFDPGGTGALQDGTLNTTNLAPGEHMFQYVSVVVGCGSDTALVTVQLTDGVVVSNITRVCNEDLGTSVISFAIAGGDAGTYQVEGVDGELIPGQPTLFTSVPLADTLGVVITASDMYECGLATFTVAPCAYEPRVFVPQSFSPNGDGVNDTFLIPGLHDYPNNTMHIYNRCGMLLYDATGYHVPGIAWRGMYRNDSAKGELPSGTYYYVLDLGDGRVPLRGFVYLNR